MEKGNGLFREKSLERISSPEDLHDYMRVTSPRLWMILGAIVIMLAGFIVFAATTRMESTEKIRVHISGDAYITGRIPLERQDLVKIGMEVRIGEWTGKITQIENSAEQRLKVAFASGELPEDDYYFISPGDSTDVEIYTEDGSMNDQLIYCYEMEGEFYIMPDDAARLGDGDMQARFWAVDLTGEKLKLAGGRLATISGTDVVVMVIANVRLDDPDLRPEPGDYDAEIVTENTSPISFLIN